MGKSSRVLRPPNSSIDPHLRCSSSSPCQSTGSGGKRPYKGVRRRSWGSWVSEIRAPHQKTRIWLGSYSTPEAAARAYDAALLCLKGSSASFNFPASLPSHLPASAMSPKSIQGVAAAAAAAAAAAVVTSPTASTTTSQSPSPPPPPSPSLDATNEDHQSTMTSSATSMRSGEIDEPWIDLGSFQSPGCMDHMINPLISSWQECEELGDMNLWSFF
ncbi:unnamed protein product [Musa textilis]